MNHNTNRNKVLIAPLVVIKKINIHISYFVEKIQKLLNALVIICHSVFCHKIRKSWHHKYEETICETQRGKIRAKSEGPLFENDPISNK